MKSGSRILTVRSRDYDTMLDRVVRLIDQARRASARSVNAIMTGTYWLIGHHIVEFEQRGKIRAAYGAELLKQLAADLSKRYGRGFSERNLEQMRLFYLGWPKSQTLSAKSAAKSQTPSAELIKPGTRFPLPWSAYVRLLTVKSDHVRQF